MGYWKNVWADMQSGMSRETAEKLNYEERYGNLPEEEKEKMRAIAEAEVKLNTMT